jgi:hypothetical protein
MNGSGYGGLVLLLLGIGLIFLAATSKGREMIGVLFNKSAPSITPANPSDTTKKPSTASGDVWSYDNGTWKTPLNIIQGK